MPDAKSIGKFVENSGNNFHAKVARWFSSSGWHVVVSPYYMDQAQSKSRELDLIAEKTWLIRDVFDKARGKLVVRLFIECKFIADEAVFWFAPKDIDAATNLVIRSGPFRERNTYTQKHHYLSQSEDVAKLFASCNSSRANENDPIFKALNQVLNGFVALRMTPSLHPDIQLKGWEKVVTIDFPVIVLSSFSKLHSTQFLEEADPKPLTENFQLEVRYAFVGKEGHQVTEYFLLDVVDFEQLDSFEKAIDEDAKAATYLSSD
jgi:hypothetical protein